MQDLHQFPVAVPAEVSAPVTAQFPQVARVRAEVSSVDLELKGVQAEVQVQVQAEGPVPAQLQCALTDLIGKIPKGTLARTTPTMHGAPLRRHMVLAGRAIGGRYQCTLPTAFMLSLHVLRVVAGFVMPQCARQTPGPHGKVVQKVVEEVFETGPELSSQGMR